MGFLKLDLVQEITALNTILNEASDFIDFSTIGSWENQKRSLEAAIARSTEHPFTLEMLRGFKIRTNKATHYKGSGGNSPVFAEFSFKWSVQRCPDVGSEFRILNGGSDVQFFNQNGNLQRAFHYDVVSGGLENENSVAYHPMTHFQFEGDLSDLPRVPSLIFSLSDVFEQVLIELWPIDWPIKATSLGSRASLQSHFANQKTRIKTIGEAYLTSVQEAALPLRGLQFKLPADLSF